MLDVLHHKPGEVSNYLIILNVLHHDHDFFWFGLVLSFVVFFLPGLGKVVVN